jgi:DNA polymerase
MSKTSVKKYEAMRRAVCKDSRIRGLLQFYGANRTGRWAGRLVQVQNLPKNFLLDLDLARNLLLSGAYDILELLFGSVPDVLSQLIRTAFIPANGNRFIVADFSAIEARVIAWLAGEQWRLDVFSTHGKIYEASAAQMFKVPVESIGKHSPLRAKGKIAELACIAEGQLVLTDIGLVPIEKITLKHKVWDGLEFVSHQGLEYRGVRDVLFYDGLIATPDHPVWVKGEQEPIQFSNASARGSRLIRSGFGRQTIRLGKDNQPRKTLGKRMALCSSINPMHRLQCRTVDNSIKSYSWAIKRLSIMLPAKTNPSLARPEINGCKAALRESKRGRIQELRRSRNTLSVRFSNASGTLDDQRMWYTKEKFGDRQNKYQQELCSGKSEMGHPSDELHKSTSQCTLRMGIKRLAVCKIRGYTETIQWHDKRASIRRSSKSSHGETEKLAIDCYKANVFDIVNAGPRNRFTVSNCLVHNCGYGGGVGALVKMGALDGGLTEDELPGLIHDWRKANPNIVKLWYEVGDKAMKAIKERTTVKFKYGMAFSYESGMFFIKLPSGRRLAYARPKIELNRFDKDGITYEGMDQTTKQWCRTDTYGPKIVENITQAIARDCLGVSMLRVDAAGYAMVMHVHDEMVIDCPNSFGSLDHVISIMAESIDWAPGLLLRGDGYETNYYKKD